MNETRQMLEDSVERLFGDRLDWDAQTKIEEHGFPRALWDEVVDQGIHKVLAAEDAGGLGGGWGDAYPVLRACGKHAVPLPVAEAMLVEYLARAAGCTLPDGVPGLLPPVLEAASLDGDSIRLADVRTPWGRVADYLVGVADGDAGAELVIASPDALAIVAEDNIGRDPRDTLSGSAAILARHPLPLPADCVRWLGALLRSAQIAGGGVTCLDLAVQYAGEREQFGRPLAAFQAIQHYLADLAGVVASVDSITMAACEAYDTRGMGGAARNARFEIAAAKCRASEAVEKLTRRAPGG
ncbi:MAG: acyl-CoA dehydrogenase family protein, partial [Gammaproteobacteria bacterium]